MVALVPNSAVSGPVMVDGGQRYLDLRAEPTSVQEAAFAPDGAGTRLEHRCGDDSRVLGWVWADVADNTDPTIGLWALTCTRCGSSSCSHVRETIDAATAVINAGPGSTPWSVAHGEVSDDLVARARAAAEQQIARREEQARRDAEALSETDRAMVEALAAARQRQQDGTPPPYRTENVTGGLGDREGGRAFGVEIEFDLPPGRSTAEARRRIGRQLFDAGITDHPEQQPYGRARQTGYSSDQWSFERDGSVAGEIVAPIMHDEPRRWEEIRTICRILRENGATATTAAGSHVTIGCTDYHQGISNHNSLLGAIHEHEDVLYRAATNPERGTHRARTSYYTGPQSDMPPNGYLNLAHLQQEQTRGSTANFRNMANRPATDRVEWRLWDATLDPAMIQAQITVSLGLTDAAARRSDWGPRNRPGTANTHRNNPRHLDQATRRRLDGYADDQQVRNLAEHIFDQPQQLEQLATLYTANRWQEF